MRATYPVLVGVFCWCAQSAYPQSDNQTKNFSFETADPSDSSHAASWLDWANGGGQRVFSSGAWDHSYVLRFAYTSTPQDISGVRQTLVYNQTVGRPIQISVHLSGTNIQNDPGDKNGATLNCHVYYIDGTMDYCPTTLQTKNVGSFPWRFIGFNTGNTVDFPNNRNADGSLKPVRSIDHIPMMGQTTGTADFDVAKSIEFHNTFQGAVTPMADDGFPEQYNLFCPTLKQNGMPCTVAAVVNYLGTPGYMTLAQLKAIQTGGGEIVDHSMSHVPMAGDSTHAPLTVSQLDHEFYDSKVWFASKGITTNHFMLPYGSYNAQVIGESQNCYINHVQCFASVRSTDRGSNPIGQFPYNIHIQEVDSNTTSNEIAGWIADAKAHHTWLIILFHKIRTNCAGDTYCTSPGMLNSTISSIIQSELPVLKYSDGFNASTALQ
jgi:hypothetical protein